MANIRSVSPWAASATSRTCSGDTPCALATDWMYSFVSSTVCEREPRRKLFTPLTESDRRRPIEGLRICCSEADVLVPPAAAPTSPEHTVAWRCSPSGDRTRFGPSPAFPAFEYRRPGWSALPSTSKVGCTSSKCDGRSETEKLLSGITSDPASANST
ncbi:hypothetical protein ABL78_8318 [Leptomonas seymouri]|uniref:Uncharacterized protein n=1 Tax=Leptomonas seymouri TaxID=5684 RepID=A0A0N1IH65_LEPSE|nr:hypothetical protein ABL78_8318 [Leptomonas seymouri]|eukprot:KPI82671.1 hypothetical protein ABL78_8318 [Leptomonas seymouri]